MPSLQQRLATSLKDLTDLPVGASAWIWLAAFGPDAPPFFVVVPQDADPSGARLVRRAQWAAGQQAPVFTAQGIVRRLPSGQLTLSTGASLDSLSTLYAALCAQVAMPDVLLLRMAEGQVTATRLLQDLSALEQAVAALSPGQTRWFSFGDRGQPDRLQLTAQRPDAEGVTGQIRRSEAGDLLLRIAPRQAPRLGQALQTWGRQVAAWPALAELSCARIVLRQPRTRKSA